MVAMAGVGMKISFQALLRQGPKAIMFGSIITVIQVAFLLAVIFFIL
jgi:uncharacterized membrane protein YadS